MSSSPSSNLSVVVPAAMLEVIGVIAVEHTNCPLSIAHALRAVR
jgi:hypothetical protein